MVSPNNEYQHPNFPLLVGKDSLDNLSLDEFHTPLAPNTEDDDSHFIQNPSSSSSSSSPPIVLGDIDSCRRNVEQVWKQSFYQPLDNATNNMCFRQQLAHGVTTYQEFLVRKYGNAQNSINVISPRPIDPMAMADSNFKVAELDNLDSQLGFPIFPLQVERKHCRSMNETIERRQKRMIKNRESAARCRARKQAYTNMLEHQVSGLRRRNEWLKKLKEAKMVLYSDSDPPSMPRYQLRRTTSSTF